MKREARRNALVALLAASVSTVLPATAAAQDYPSRPIRMLVGFSAGGGVDAIARTLAARLSEQLGQNVVVENRPGATSTIAANVLVSSPPDGYTVFLADSSLLIAAREGVAGAGGAGMGSDRARQERGRARRQRHPRETHHAHWQPADWSCRIVSAMAMVFAMSLASAAALARSPSAAISFSCFWAFLAMQFAIFDWASDIPVGADAAGGGGAGAGAGLAARAGGTSCRPSSGLSSAERLVTADFSLADASPGGVWPCRIIQARSWAMANSLRLIFEDLIACSSARLSTLRWAS
jgi:hypothetical protein